MTHQQLERTVNVTLVTLFISLFALSLALSWYRYVANGNFHYYLTEDEAPDRMDLSTYPK